jgi:hypothetical protein
MQPDQKQSQPRALRRFVRSVGRTIGLSMAGLGFAAGWTPPKVDKPPIEWARDRDEYDQAHIANRSRKSNQSPPKLTDPQTSQPPDGQRQPQRPGP